MQKTPFIVVFIFCTALSPSFAFATPTQVLSNGFSPVFLQDTFGSLFTPFVHAFAIPSVNPETIKEVVHTASTACQKLNSARERYECYQKTARSLMVRSSFQEVNLALDDADFDCHDIMHSIAQEAYRRYGSLSRVYEESTFSCFGAAYHGAAEGYLLAHSRKGASQESLVDAMLGGCLGALDSHSPLYMQCVHGIGHALMFITANELHQSLALCDSFESTGERVNCYGGVFMENTPSSQLSPHESRYARTDDLYYPCPTLLSSYQASCYHFQFSRLLEKRWASVSFAEFCDGIPGEFQPQCYKDAGLSIAVSFSENHERISACREFSDAENVARCLQGVVRFYLDRFAGVQDKLSDSFDFCADLPALYADTCYFEVGQIMAGYVAGLQTGDQQERAEGVCVRAGAYQDACVRGIFTEQIPI